MSGEILNVHVSDLISLCSKEVKGSNPIDTFFSKILFSYRSVFFDERYKTVKEHELRSIIDFYKDIIESNKLHYEKDYFDCDDFALVFKSIASSHFNTNAIGIALGLVVLPDGRYGMHAWNVAVTDNKEILHIEPQLFEIVKNNVSSDKFKYYLKWVIW